MLTSRARVVTGPVRIKKKYPGILYTIEQNWRMSLEETCNVILAQHSYEYLFKDKQLKVIDSILRREDTVQVRHKKNSFSLQMQFLIPAISFRVKFKCCIPSVRCTCQTTPNACRVKNHRYSEFLVCTGRSSSYILCLRARIRNLESGNSVCYSVIHFSQSVHTL